MPSHPNSIRVYIRKRFCFCEINIKKNFSKEKKENKKCFRKKSTHAYAFA